MDCDKYHLGAPWQYLQTHRVLFEHIPYYFHSTLQVDFTFAIPLLLGDDRLAKWMVVSYFFAASAVFAARCRRDGAQGAGWIGPLLALSIGQLLWLVTVAKNDIPAASLFVAGCVLTQARRWTLGAALLGLCVAAKIVYGPLVAIWLLFHPPPWRTAFRFGFILLLPLIPWWIKSYLALGNPIYPFGYAWIPSLDWGPENRAAYDHFVAPILHPDTMSLEKLPGAWVRHMRGFHLPLLLALPGMALLGRDRRAVWACAVGSIAIMGIGHIHRYTLPAAWLLSLLVVKELARCPQLLRRIAIGLVAVYALLRIWLPTVHTTHWREAFVPLPATFQRYLTTRQEALQTLGRLKARTTGLERPQPTTVFKVCSVGEGATYRFPARLLHGGMEGETPLIWKLAKAAHDPAELRKKFKQLGTSVLMYNFVSAEWLERRYDMFPWNKRMIQMYVEFLKRYLTPLARPVKCDYFNGGFYVFRILPQPLEPPATEVWFTPGMESVYARATTLMIANRVPEALQEYLAVLKLLPDVAHAWNVVGHVYLFMNDYPNGYKYLRRFGEKGVMDSMNLAEYGTAAFRVGQLELAERVLQDALPRYPEHQNIIRINLSLLWATKASQLMAARRLREAEPWLNKAREMLNQVPEGGTKAQKDSRRTTLAQVLALHGEFRLRRGDDGRAADYFLRAYRTAPESPEAQRWKDIGDRLQRRMFGAGTP